MVHVQKRLKVAILRTLFLILLLTPISTGNILEPSDTKAPQYHPLEGGSQQISHSDTKTPQQLPSRNKRHSIPSPPSDTQTTPQLSPSDTHIVQLSPSDERTLQREFLLQQFIHRLTTTPHQTILRTQVSWETEWTSPNWLPEYWPEHFFHKTAQTRLF